MTTTIRNGRGDLITAIGGPCDVQALPESQLPELAVQMRRRLIETVTATGGHLGAGLGMVELGRWAQHPRHVRGSTKSGRGS